MQISRLFQRIAATGTVAILAIAAFTAPCVAAVSIVPALNSHNFYGYGAAKVSVTPVTGEPFKTAETIITSAPGQNPWVSGAATPGFTKKVGKGDRLIATFYVRSVSPASAKMELSIELPKPPYTSSGRKTVTATKAWRKVSVAAVAIDNYAPGGIHIVFHTAYAKETVQIGGLTVIDNGH